nr:hypothetical protein [Tanacetum cinerariifolium]
MQSMKDNEVWVLDELPPNGKTVGSKWLLKKKTDMDEAVHTYKARLVAKVYTQTPGIDYKETFSLVANIRAIRILIAIAAYYDYEIWQIDVKTASSMDISMKRNTKDMFLVYEGDLKRELGVSCYTDAGYPIDADDLKSQTRYVFILNGGDVDWKSAKQIIFATSSAEAEYIAAFDASKEAMWVRKFIFELGVVHTIEEPISMYCDNTGAIAIANESGITKGARHFHAKVHYICKVIEYGDVKLEKVHKDDNLADPFTKALAFPKHSEHTRNIGIFPASSLIKSREKKGNEIEKNLGGNGMETREIEEELVIESNSNGREQTEIIGSINNEDVPIINKTDINEGINKNANDKNPRIYANMVKNDEVLINKNLIFIALKVNEDGVVAVLFDKEIMNQGCVKWQFTIRGSDCSRVLVEIKAKKELKDVIKIEYIRENEHVKGTKEVVVMYD